MTSGVAAEGAGFQPYVGLRAFQADEQGLFFGRTKESLDIARIWRANKLTVLYGASGVGKTSLLQAGVIPTLDRDRFDVWPVGRIRPHPVFPVAAVTGSNPYTVALLSSWAPGEAPSSLTGVTILGFLDRQNERQDRYGDPIPMLVAIDQAEELFNGLPQRQNFLRMFVAELADALREREGVRLLLSLREDYLAAVLPYEQQIAGRSRTRLRLLPFGHDAALEAVRGPLRGTVLSFEAGAAEELVTDLRTVKVTNALGEESTVIVDSVEPVQIQIVCSALLNSLPQGISVITSSHVREHAVVDRFLASFCSLALSAVAKAHDIAAARIRSWLQQTFVTELGTRGTTYEGIDQTAGMPNAVVRALEDRHILKAEYRSGTRWYELQHDHLIRPIRQADPEEHLKAAWLARTDGDWDLVERYAVQAIRVFGADELRVRADAEYLLGEVAQERSQPDEALEHYRTAAGLFEVLQDSAAVGKLLAAAGRLSLARGLHNDAVTDLRAAIVRIPGDLDAHTDLARAMWHTGQPRAAVAVLNGVLNLESNVMAALRARGEILADLEDVEGALRDLDRVRHDQEPSTLAARALALALSGRLDAAQQEAADARANGQNHGPVLLRTARVLALSGEREEALLVAAVALTATDPPLPPHLRDYAQRLVDASQDTMSSPGDAETRSD
jgi:tetratricopeptide (TPR) repeat protein